MDLAPSLPGRRTWDPRTEPYTAPACKADRHRECPGSLAYYPQGIDGPCEDIPCACDREGCSCARRRTS